ncbi:MAG TPA: hypothetical protein VHF26_23790 [Trebonia sp.]|nr:hypothetical protein [Trebonia sp.]
MYLWTLVGNDTAEGSVLAGLDQTLAGAMRATEPALTERRAFACLIVEVVARMSVFHLEVIHVPTGREWSGRRASAGGVHWDARFVPPDPDTAYTLAAPGDLSTRAG